MRILAAFTKKQHSGSGALEIFWVPVLQSHGSCEVKQFVKEKEDVYEMLRSRMGNF